MTTPWKNADQGGKYIAKSARFVRNEIRAGRLRGARIGGKGEILTCDQWLDEYIAERAQPVMVRPFRREVG